MTIARSQRAPQSRAVQWRPHRCRPRPIVPGCTGLGRAAAEQTDDKSPGPLTLCMSAAALALLADTHPPGCGLQRVHVRPPPTPTLPPTPPGHAEPRGQDGDAGGARRQEHPGGGARPGGGAAPRLQAGRVHDLPGHAGALAFVCVCARVFGRCVWAAAASGCRCLCLQGANRQGGRARAARGPAAAVPLPNVPHAPPPMCAAWPPCRRPAASTSPAPC